MSNTRTTPFKEHLFAWEGKDRQGLPLRGELKAAGDPRVSGDGQTFEREPFTGLPKPAAKPKRAK